MTVGLPDEISVPEAVRQILTRSYPVYQSLKMRVVNFHALAELIQPEVKEMTHRDASINTLVVAIKRFSDTLDSMKKLEVGNVLDNARISLTSGIVDLTIKAPRAEFSKIVRDVSEIGAELSEFPHIFPLATSIKLIVPDEDYEKIKEKLGHFTKGPLIHAAKLTLRMSPSAEMTSGIASYLTELLYRNGVNIYDAFLGYGDIIMVVDDRDGPQAYEILQREVNRQALKA
ncbi:ACT domain-containing protein [Candidatus Bathyarchaeota archaeon]|nr:MAG: ACT domain-containing protein [Candidatus Bathyarchaeota archaeon]